MFISPSMLERLYLRGSLKNTDDGFQFKIKNTVDSGTLGGIKTLVLDEAELPLSNVIIRTPSTSRGAEEITARAPLFLTYGAEMTVSVTGTKLTEGKHTIVLTVNVLEVGRLEFKVNDEVA